MTTTLGFRRALGVLALALSATLATGCTDGDDANADRAADSGSVATGDGGDRGRAGGYAAPGQGSALSDTVGGRQSPGPGQGQLPGATGTGTGTGTSTGTGTATSTTSRP